MHVITVYAYGRPAVLRASTSRQLSQQLYQACPWWTRKACAHLALELLQNRAILAPDFDAVLIPGDWSILETRPAEADDYRPAWA